MVQFIEVNGEVSIEKAMEFRFGQMVPNMLAIGKIIWLMEKVYFTMLMEIYMRECGLMTKLMVLEYIFIQTEQDMKVIGQKMPKTGKERRSGLMALFLKGLTKKVKSMEKVITFGVIIPSTKETGRIITSTDMELTSGLMEDNIKETGKTITCMAREFTPGLMAGAMKANTTMTKNMDMASTNGLMAESIMASGKKANNMERANMCYHLVSREKVSGKMDIESNGPQKKLKLDTHLFNLYQQLIYFINQILYILILFYFKQ